MDRSRPQETHTDQCYCARCWQLLGPADRFCDDCGANVTARGAMVRVTFGPVVRAGGRYPSRIVGIYEDYVLESVAGEGGMGKVYRAMHRWSAQEFAVKMIGDSLRFRPNMVKLFASEAETQSLLIHPNVVRVFRFLEHQRQAALVMEYVEGDSLDRVIATWGGQLGLSQNVWILRQMLAGLDVVHQQGIIHADVKPANFLYGRANGQLTVKIADFGIARRVRSEVLAQQGRRSGTPEYMPPEQWTGAPLGPSSDLYSLGCVLYELLAGRPMVDLVVGGASGPGWQGAAPSLGTLRPDVPRALVDLVTALFATSPAHRPQTAREVLRALDQLQGGAP